MACIFSKRWLPFGEQFANYKYLMYRTIEVYSYLAREGEELLHACISSYDQEAIVMRPRASKIVT
jgi:hypothetical protein